MWCGAPPETALLAPCCTLVVAALFWAIAALGALACEAGSEGGTDYDAVVCIVSIASMLMVMGHALPDSVSLLIAGVMAIATGLIAVTIAFEPRAKFTLDQLS